MAATAVSDRSAGGRGLRCLHAITGLAIGGAEWMLYRVLAAGDHERFAPTVVSLMTPGALAPRIAGLGVPIASLHMRRGPPLTWPVLRLRRLVRALQPDLLQGWMYHGNLAATAAWRCLESRPPLVWTIHHSAADLSNEKLSTRLSVQVSARLSRLTAAIAYCSSASARQHHALGFAPERTVVIPNGFDCAQTRPDPAARPRLCAELGIDPARTLVGMVARGHPMKDHRNLVRAVALLVERQVDVHLVMVGRGVGDPNGEIARAVAAAGIGQRTTLLGERADINPLTAGLDILALSSAWGEAFPLIVGDAMASGVPCVVTDVGDCVWIVGDTGEAVPPRDSAALAAAIGRLVALGPAGRHRLGRAARARIEENFSLAGVVRQYEALHQRLTEEHARAARGRRAFRSAPATSDR
jgi:glycosyltransferase involved in cell wall biosynthesis